MGKVKATLVFKGACSLQTVGRDGSGDKMMLESLRLQRLSKETRHLEVKSNIYLSLFKIPVHSSYLRDLRKETDVLYELMGMHGTWLSIRELWSASSLVNKYDDRSHRFQQRVTSGCPQD